MDLEKIKERIRKLLAKADNTACTVEEAKAFNDKAYELLAEYNLERAQVEESQRESVRTHKTLTVVVRPWSTAILHGLCHLYFCKWYYSRQGRSDTVTMVGEESNVAMCHAIAVMILRAIQQEARSTGLGRSFMTGAGYTIHQRCQEMRPTQQLPKQASSTGTALMVLGNQEQAENTRYIAEVLKIAGFAKAKKSRARVNSSDGYSRGKAFGSSLPLSNNLLGGR